MPVRNVIRKFEPKPPTLFALRAEESVRGVEEHYLACMFPVAGQGTISLTFRKNMPFRVVLNHRRGSSGGSREVIVLEVSDKRAAFLRANTHDPADVLAETTDPKALLNPGEEKLAYWLSLDKNNRVLKLGKGEMFDRLVVFSFALPPLTNEAPDPFAFIAQLKYIAVSEVERGLIEDHALRSMPVTMDPPPQIIPSAEITLEDIAANLFCVAADLPSACQVLYDNVAGPGITLRPKDFEDFPEAIDHSINTPGLFCYEVLKKKGAEFGYLRITLGGNQGDSPGSPYVLEIWPAKHGSPIHNHGHACAVIKVLRGAITVEWFPGLAPEIEQGWGEVTLQEGDVTFLTPQAYQIHRLHNPGSEKMTATIQCYRYPDGDRRHYEYFDYLEDGAIKQFTPDSDAMYLEFKETVRKEWVAHKESLKSK